MLQIIIFLVLIISAYFIGTTIEKNHLQSLSDRELRTILLPAVPARMLLRENCPIEKAQLVFANAVISIDYFKRISAALRNIFGGEVSAYESVLDRARREAILRMKEQAAGANIIINIRIETATIGRNKKGNIACAEVLAYGTAITYKGKTFQSIQEQLRPKK